MIYYTSDTHFFHLNILRYQLNRKHSSIEEMNCAIIEAWNSVVTDKDTVIHLGDFLMGQKAIGMPQIVPILNGRKVICLGNHDPSATAMLKYGFDEVHNKLELDIDDFHVLLRHYPPSEEEYKKFHYCLHGHTHGGSHRENGAFPGQIDVGVDVQGYTPKTFKQLIEGVPPNKL